MSFGGKEGDQRGDRGVSIVYLYGLHVQRARGHLGLEFRPIWGMYNQNAAEGRLRVQNLQLVNNIKKIKKNLQ